MVAGPRGADITGGAVLDAVLSCPIAERGASKTAAHTSDAHWRTNRETMDDFPNNLSDSLSYKDFSLVWTNCRKINNLP